MKSFTKLLIWLCKRAMSKLERANSSALKVHLHCKLREPTLLLFEAFDVQLAYTGASVAACACKTPNWHRMTGYRRMHAPAYVDVFAAKLQQAEITSA